MLKIQNYSHQPSLMVRWKLFIRAKPSKTQANAAYELSLGITGPDDTHPNRNNNAFTLCAASLAIHWARYFSCLCQRNEREEVPDEYVQKAMYLNLPYDNVKRLHLQFQGFDAGNIQSFHSRSCVE